LKFAGLCLAVTVAAGAVGWIPTVRRAGPEGAVALLAGCGVSLAAALIGGLVIARVPGTTPQGSGVQGSALQAGPQALFATLGAMGVRLVLVLGLGTAVALSGAVAVKPFLLWMGLSYLALLPGETRYALAAAAETTPAPPRTRQADWSRAEREDEQDERPDERPDERQE